MYKLGKEQWAQQATKPLASSHVRFAFGPALCRKAAVRGFWSSAGRAGRCCPWWRPASSLIPVAHASVSYSASPTVPGNGRSTRPCSFQTEC